MEAVISLFYQQKSLVDILIYPLYLLLGVLGKFKVWLGQKIPNFKEMEFLTLWELQSRVATLVRLGLVAVLTVTIGFLPAIVITSVAMLPWGIIATLYYERRRRLGLADVFEVGVEAEVRSRNGWRWSQLGLKLFFFIGLQTWISAWLANWLFRQSGQRQSSHWGQRLLRLGAMVVCLIFFGVTPAHHVLSRAGYDQDEVLRRNLLGRIPNTVYVTAIEAPLMLHVMTIERILHF